MASEKHHPFQKHPSGAFRPCDFPGCPNEGEFRAPRDRSLSDYYLFCKDHIRIYNESWDYYKGMSAEEIEHHMKEDVVWQRPTWKMGVRGSVFLESIQDPFFLDEFLKMGLGGGRGPSPTHKPDSKEERALVLFSLNLPFSKKDLKDRYKEFAKKYHPDKTGGDKLLEEKFKEISDAYRLLIKKVEE